MNNMDQMQNFIKGLKSQTRKLLDASARGTIRQMNEPQVKDLIKKMCMNEYRAKSKISVKFEMVGTPKGMLTVNTQTALLAQIELLNKQLVEGFLNRGNVSQIQALMCDLCGGEHVNERCSLEGTSEEVQFANFQKNNLYSNMYKEGSPKFPMG